MEASSTPPTEARSRRSRSRRRRKATSWGKFWRIVLIALPVLMIVGYVGFKLWLNSYMGSPQFRTMLSNKVSAMLEADGEFTGLTWENPTLKMPGFEARGYSDTPFSQLRVSDIQAQIDIRYSDREVYSEQINISRVQALIEEKGRLRGSFLSNQPHGGSSASSSGGFLSSLAPNKLRVGKIIMQQFDATYRDQEGVMQLEHLPLLIKPGANEGQWTLESRPSNDRARLATTFGGGFSIKLTELQAVVKKKQFDLIELGGELQKLKPIAVSKDAGLAPTRLTCSGLLDKSGPQSQLDFDLNVHDIRLEEWVEEDWVKRLTGLAELKLKLRGNPSVPATLEGNGTFVVKRGVLQALPVLERLAERTKTPEFTRLDLNTAQCEFIWKNGELHLNNIDVEARGLIRLQGYLAIKGQQVRGTLHVGVTPGRLRAIDGAEQRVFTRDAEGYRWATPPMKVWGTLKNLEEDLSTRIKDAWFDQQIENVTEIATKAPEKVFDVGTKSVETGTKLIEEGVRAAPNIIDKGVRIFEGFLPK